MNCQDLRANIALRTIEQGYATANYPEVIGLLPANQNARYKDAVERINQTLERFVRMMMLENGATNPNLGEMAGNYKVTLNRNGVLSIRFENVSNIRNAAHPVTMVRGLTFNLRTGNTVDIASLFESGRGHRLIISNEIKRQIKVRNIPLISEFTRINDDQEYYLTDKALVVFFQRGDIAAGAAGVLEFPIPYTVLGNIIDRQCILGPVVCC